MKKHLLSFSKNIPQMNVVCSALITLVICLLTKQTPIYLGVALAIFWSWQNNVLMKTFDEFMGQNYDHKITDFFDEYFFLPIFYLAIGVAFAVVSLFTLKQANSFTIGWIVGIFFPIMLRSVYSLRDGYGALEQIDADHD